MTVTAVNARDVALKNTPVRVIGVSTNYIGLTCPTLQFKYGTDNQPQPVSAVVTATLYGNLQGTVTFTYAGFSTAPTITGNTLAINPENFSGDVVTINASLNYQGVNYQAVPITISKIFNQLVAKTTRPIDLLPSYTDGTGYTLPAADNYIELYNGVSKLTTGVVYSPATQTKNGVTATVNTATGLITISEATPNAWTSNSESFTFTATRNLIAYTTAYTITKAKQGTGGAQLAEIALYQWSTAQPAAPTGTSTYTWLTKAHAYVGTDSWKETVQTSPGGTNIKLWQVTVGILAQSSLSTTTYVVASTSWAGGTIRQITTESNALIKTYRAKVYRNSIGSPTPPAGTTTYTWLTNNIAAAPTNWNTAPPSAQTGYTLYEAAVDLIAAQADTVSAIDWTLSSITPVRYYGTDGASARRAYALVTSSSTPNAGLASYTATGDSLPEAGTWFTGITWTPAAPTTIDENKTLYQSDGVFVTNGNTSWGFPYISSLKVGNLAAITVNTGGLNVSDYIKGGNATSLTTGNGFYVDSNGYLRVGSATGSQLRFDANGLAITDSSGNSIFTVVSNANTNASTAVSTATTALQSSGGITWIVSSDIEIVTGTQLKKVGSTDQVWSAQAYSAESYTSGAYVSFQAARINRHLMLGLNTDPTTNASYDSIDHAWYCIAGSDGVNGPLYYYENGAGADTGLTYTINTVLSIIYDNRYVKYYRDGVLVRTVDKGVNSNIKYYLDSSFYNVNSEVKSVRFGPLGKIGDKGDAATVAVGSITTGAEGTSATVTNSGTTSAAVLDFTIPKGATGAASTVPGPRGSKWAYIDATSFVQNTVDTYFNNTYGGKVGGDIVTVYNAATNFSQTWVWNGSAWTQITVVIDGSLLVTGTVAGNKLTSDFLETRWATIGTLRSAASGSRIEIKSDVIKVYEGETLRVRLGNLSA